MTLYQQAVEVVGDDPETFMSSLRRTLQSHGKTFADLSRVTGISLPLIYQWTGGHKNPCEWSRLRLDDGLQRLLYG